MLIRPTHQHCIPQAISLYKNAHSTIVKPVKNPSLISVSQCLLTVVQFSVLQPVRSVLPSPAANLTVQHNSKQAPGSYYSTHHYSNPGLPFLGTDLKTGLGYVDCTLSTDCSAAND